MEKEKTPDRQRADSASGGGIEAEKPQQLGGLDAHGRAAALAGDPRVAAFGPAYDTAHDNQPKRVGAPKKADRARKDYLRDFAAGLGATPGEVLLASALKGLKAYLDRGGELQDFLEDRANALAWQLEIAPAAAYDRLVARLENAMPYVHQKLPMAVELDTPGIAIVMVAPDGSLTDQSGGLDMRPKNVRLSSDIDNKTGKSDGESLTIDAKASENSEVDGDGR